MQAQNRPQNAHMDSWRHAREDEEEQSRDANLRRLACASAAATMRVRRKQWAKQRAWTEVAAKP
jgi:hypothetical protein